MSDQMRFSDERLEHAFELASQLRKLGRFAEALEPARAAVAEVQALGDKDSRFIGAYFLLGAVHYGLGDRENVREAEMNWNRAIYLCEYYYEGISDPVAPVLYRNLRDVLDLETFQALIEGVLAIRAGEAVKLGDAKTAARFRARITEICSRYRERG